MARQPYLPTFSKVGYTIGFNSIAQRPAFAAIIGECITTWSYVDNEMGTLFGQLLGIDSEAAIEVFLSLRRSASQRDALVAAAKHTLKGDVMLAFEAVMAVYRALEGQRNDLAHGCFGYSHDHPDILLWIELKHHVHYMADSISKELKGIRDGDAHAELKKHLYVYRMKDLEALREQIVNMWFAGFHLNCYLRRSDTTLGAQSFSWLCAVPQIEREMSRLKAARKSIPSTQWASPRSE